MHYLDKELNALITQDEQLWQYIQQASLDGLWFWDLEHPENLYISPEYWHVLGIDPSTRKHSPDEFIAVVFDEDLPNIMDNLERHYAEPTIKYEQIVRFKHSDGSTVYVRCRGKAIRDANGKAIRMLGAHNNITPEMKRQKELEQALSKILSHEDELKEAMQDRQKSLDALSEKREQEQQMMAVIAHELRTPIATISMLLEGRNSPHELDELQFKIIQNAVVQALNVLGDLKSISQHSALAKHALVSTDIHMYFVSMHQQLIEIVHTLDPNIQLSLNLGKRLLRMPLVELNTQALFQIVSNLVCNAAKHAQCHKIVLNGDCELTDEGRYKILVKVTDNGTGISEAEANRVFKPFLRGEGSSEDGSGLGLAIANGLTELLGGELCLTPNQAGGSVFGFDFVVASAANDRSSTGSVKQNTDYLTGKTIIFAEDNDIIQTISKDALERAGAHVITFDNGADALAFVDAKHHFDYLFTDIFMPQMNGYELCKELRLRNIQQPIVAVTASVLGEEVQKAMQSGAKAVIEKPMSIASVQATLGQIG
ncbi:hybrid sensor histidine kinase/response regulator [Opacimonas viscosa]|uniref:histidine kinase n=1 Tax=Opacimonas viscosa TaxID=2961944 RepID=A0AA41X4P6_9ALTE|nr:response regulator [Opacimonas viscosa]MCP3429752.1 response regulator [Opacimonas viscosa]